MRKRWPHGYCRKRQQCEAVHLQLHQTTRANLVKFVQNAPYHRLILGLSNLTAAGRLVITYLTRSSRPVISAAYTMNY